MSLNKLQPIMRYMQNLEDMQVKKDLTKIITELQAQREEVEAQKEEIKRQQCELHSINRDLELSRQKYFDLYNLAPIGYFTFDAYGLLLEVNRAGAQLIGTEPHLITGQPIVSFIEKEHRRIFFLHLSEIFKNGGQQTCELKLIRKDGQCRYVHVETKAVRAASGDRRLISAFTNITEQKQNARNALTQSEDKFEKAFHNSPGFLFISDFETGKFIDVNRAYCELTGYSAGELIGKSSLELEILTSDQRTRLIDGLKNFGWLKNQESTIRTKKGDARIRIFSASLVELGGKKCIIASGVDITERKQFELDLKKSEFEKSLILNSTSEFIAYFDTGMRLQWANRSWLESVDKNLGQLIGQKCHELRYNRSEPCAGCPVYKTLSTGNPETADLQMTDGRIFNIRSYPVRDESRELIAVIDFSKDITEQKKAEQSLLTAYDRLEEKVRERTAELERRNQEIKKMGQLTIKAMEIDRKALSKELHDGIGGTLAAIKYQLENRVEKVGPPPPSIEMPLEKIITYLSDAIKESRRITKQLRPSVLDDFGLVAAIDEHINDFLEFHPTIKVLKRISINEDKLSNDAKTVLYRVLQEALNNVGKHSNADHIDIQCFRFDGWIKLKIQDNGIGFNAGGIMQSPNALEGYGLYGMKERVEICKGDFHIESAPGKGTTLIASIPLGLESPNE